MNAKTLKRLNNELKAITEDNKIDGIEIIPSDDIKEFYANINGPPNSPYQNGVFKLEIKIPDNYPLTPPNVKFVSKIFHPNIYTDGKICVDILRKENWAPTLKISSVLLSIQSLFTDPDPMSAANPEAGRLYRKDREKFNSEASKFSQTT